MNKLGFYVENTTVPFLRDAFVKVKPPVLLVHAQDRGLLREIRNTLSPDTFVVGRVFVDLPQQNAWLTGGDPEGAARAFAEQIINYDFEFAKEKGAKGRLLFDAWMSLNEPVRGPASFLDGKPDAETLARYDALDRFQVAFLERLRARWAGGGRVQLRGGQLLGQEPRRRLLPAVAGRLHLPRLPRVRLAVSDAAGRHVHRRAPVPSADAGHPRAAREQAQADHHGGRAGAHVPPPAGPGRAMSAGSTAGRRSPRRSTGSRSSGTTRQMAQDDYVMGACLYQVGHGGQWETFRHLGQDNQQQPILLMDKIATLRETATPPPPTAATPPAPPAANRRAGEAASAHPGCGGGDAGGCSRMQTPTPPA